jgi:hypothetical protein
MLLSDLGMEGPELHDLYSKGGLYSPEEALGGGSGRGGAEAGCAGQGAGVEGGGGGAGSQGPSAFGGSSQSALLSPGKLSDMARNGGTCRLGQMGRTTFVTQDL